MKTQILQGINLEYAITTIKITFDEVSDLSTIVPILELIKSFHPIFMAGYKFEVTDGNNILIINSKLPKLWREAAQSLNDLALNKITEDQAKDYILNTVIKKQVLSMSTIPSLYAAHKLGYETTQFYTNGEILEQNSSMNRYYCIGTGKKSHIIVSFAGSGDSHIAQKTQKDKWSTNTVIKRLGLPIAKWQMFSGKEELDQIFDNYRKPFVIKPTGLVGGHGVTTGIITKEQAYKAIEIAQASIEKRDGPEWQRKMMIQEQVSGEDYRVLVINGKFMIATKRIPAFIIGNGISTIEQLIIETNKDPRRNVSNPTHTLKPIVIDQVLIDFLTEQSLTLASIPANDQQIQVRKPASMSLGGITEDFTDKVHPQIKYICETLASSIHAYTLGVDIICNDISSPLTNENGSIIEMNTMPEGYLNTYPVIGKQYPETNEIYIKGLLDKLPEVKQVVIASSIKNQESNSPISISEIHKLVTEKLSLAPETKIGIYQSGCIYINETLINSGLTTEEATEALKLNASLDVIVFSYPDLKEVEEHGYGFDRIDLSL